MTFAVFNESFYLANNSDVQAAVKAGIFKSALEHFQQYGIKEGRLAVSPFYNESVYLQKNPDVAAAVKSGSFRSGLEHFIQFGETENRQASVLFDPNWYDRKNPDVTAAVKAGNLSSGFAHYLQFGQSENRAGTNFNEFAYFYGVTPFGPPKQVNPDVEAAVKASVFGSALEHYINSGQFEGRGGTFNGTRGSDIVTGFGQQDTIYGVELDTRPCVNFRGTLTGGICMDFVSTGVNEIDVLIGGSGKDTFVLGQRRNIGGEFVAVFYRGFPGQGGGGDSDYASIENFEIGKDEIILGGAVDNYDFVQSGDSLKIVLSRTASPASLPSPDLVATVRGVTSFSEIANNVQFTGGFLA